MAQRHALADIYALVERTPGTVLLEGISKQSTNNEEPWTRLFTAPLRICVARDAADLTDLFAAIEQAVKAGHYAAGYFTYECGAAFEPRTAAGASDSNEPLAWIGIYDRAYLFDAAAGNFHGDTPPGYRSAGEAAGDAEVLSAHFAMEEEEYAKRIAGIHEWIRAGDIYQLNFTAPMCFEIVGGAAALYERLRSRQEAQYGAFVHAEAGRQVLSFSPELFFRVDDNGGNARRITTRPMKGTAARGRTNGEDREIAEWLRNDEKNRAENLMIVDLLRNDLGRIAQFGSVRVDNLFAVERLSTLWQMTSTISAAVREDVGCAEIFRALFPCGSVTGAPKIRAMQRIAEIEEGPRGVYTGAIGFFSPEETIFNVAIRTIVLEDGRGTMGVGSGIVIDSETPSEYRECLLKAEFVTRSDRAQTDFSLIETMLWEGSFPLLDLHLERLADSADYFGIACNVASIRSALEHHAAKFSSKEPRRIRFLLGRNGQMSIAHQLLPPAADPGFITRVRVAAERTNALDRLLYHKTTHRHFYDAAFEAAAREGFADVLFFNTQGELTEGAISNVFIEKDGRWATPPIACGLLGGVYRRHLLETRRNTEVRILYEEDLRNADAVYICNALRGLRKVQPAWE